MQRICFPFFRYLAQQLACPPLVWRPHVLGIVGLSRTVCFTCNAVVVSCLATSPSCSHVSCSLSVHWIIKDVCFTCNGFIVSCSATSPSSSHVSRSFSIHWLIEAGLLHVQQIRFLFLGPSPCSSRVHRSFSCPAARVPAAHLASTGVSRLVASRATDSLSPAQLPRLAARMSAAHAQQIRFPFLGTSPSNSHVHHSFSGLLSWVQLDY